MSYIPPDRSFRAIRDDQRDDAIGVSRTDDMLEWNRGHSSVARKNPSAFAAVSYRVDHQRTHVPRPPEQRPWHQEREWRRPMLSNNVHRPRLDTSHAESKASFPTDQLHSWSSADPNSPVTYQSSTWNTGAFPTVSQINEHHQLSSSGRGRGLHSGVPREVQAISMSSSNGSSTASMSCRSPYSSKTVVGEKRLGETLASEAVLSPHPDSSKRFKPSPVPAPAPQALASVPVRGGFDMLNLLCSATLGTSIVP